MKRWLPKSLAGQTVLVLLAGLTISHILSMAIYASDRAEVLMLASEQQIAHRMAEITRLLAETPTEWHERIVDAVSGPSLRVSLTPESMVSRPADESWQAGLVRRFLARLVQADADTDVVVQLLEAPGTAHSADIRNAPAWMLAHMTEMITGQPMEHALRVSIRLRGGEWANFATAFPETISLWSSQAILSTVLMAIAVALLSFWVVRRMTRPLTAFANAAERLGRDVSAPPMEETGPLEVRRAVRAFNDMQRRLRRLIENRTRMLVAISHDLKTPITLLRLRTEYVPEENRRKMHVTLDEMEAMIASTLAFAREDAEPEERRVVDLTSLVGSICDDMADAGRPVAFGPAPPLKLLCRPLALKRAVANVIDNAVKYGGNARVRLVPEPTFVDIVIDDDGPGILEAELKEVFQPFYRLERSRSRETGGAGLGLSVAQTIVHAHGGDMRLSNRKEGGLCATIHLPR